MHFMTSHEWAKEEDGTITIGLSAFAAGEVGEVIHVELPSVGATVTRGEAIAEIESVKSVNDYYAPVSGEVVAVNDGLGESPELLNQDAEGAAWFAKIKPSDDSPFADLMDTAAYQAHTAG